MKTAVGILAVCFGIIGVVGFAESGFTIAPSFVDLGLACLAVALMAIPLPR